MTATISMGVHIKPRVLIADDSRIVRAALIKHIEGMFDFREALDGMQAWEILLVDPSIRVVITDLTMPGLDGYGLLGRIRNSKIPRIRDIPVIVVSGSDQQEERERAKAAGATDLITKGIATAQLLSRLDVLVKLPTTQGEFERSLEILAQGSRPIAEASYPDSPNVFYSRAAELLASAARSRRNFVILCIHAGLRPVGQATTAEVLPPGLADTVGNLLRHMVRQTDRVAITGEAEFMLATGSINADAANIFGQRLCQAIGKADLPMHGGRSLIASGGVVSLRELGEAAPAATLTGMCDIARRRAAQGLARTATGVVGPEEALASERSAH
jgi:PleD family two-component response regulator